MAVGDFDGPLFTKTDYAYAALRKRIMSGALPHGSAVSQEALAAELNVSTTPLREAMRRLASEGLVILDAHRDARVAPLTADEARSLFEVRQRLDPLAVRLAAERRSEADSAASESRPPRWNRWWRVAAWMPSTRTALSTRRFTGRRTTIC